jgi:hypothetical protein
MVGRDDVACGMRDGSVLLVRLRAAVKTLARLEAAAVRRDALIGQLHALGWSPHEIAAAAGLSLRRVGAIGAAANGVGTVRSRGRPVGSKDRVKRRRRRDARPVDSVVDGAPVDSVL